MFRSASGPWDHKAAKFVSELFMPKRGAPDASKSLTSIYCWRSEIDLKVHQICKTGFADYLVLLLTIIALVQSSSVSLRSLHSLIQDRTQVRRMERSWKSQRLCLRRRHKSETILHSRIHHSIGSVPSCAVRSRPSRLWVAYYQESGVP